MKTAIVILMSWAIAQAVHPMHAAFGAETQQDPKASVEVHATDVRIFAPIPGGALNTAMFFTLKNSGKKDVQVVRAESEWAEVVELHTHIEDNGVMKMRPVPEIVIPARGQIELKPGGLHLMFIGIKKPMKTGQKVEAKIYVKDGASIVVRGPVIGRR